MKCETLLVFLSHLFELRSKGVRVLPKDDSVKLRYGFQNSETLEVYELSYYDVRANKNYLIQREELVVVAGKFGLDVESLLQILQDPYKRERFYRG